MKNSNKNFQQVQHTLAIQLIIVTATAVFIKYVFFIVMLYHTLEFTLFSIYILYMNHIPLQYKYFYLQSVNAYIYLHS